MAGASVFPRSDKTSVKHRKITLVEASSASSIASFDYADIPASENDKCCQRNPDPQSSQMLRTSDLISALGYAWDRARWPRSAPLSENKLTCKTEVVQSGDTVHYSTDEGTLHTSTSADDEPCSSYLNCQANFVKQLRESLKHSKQNQPSGKLFSSWGRVLARSAVIDNSSTANCFTHTGIPPDWGSAYTWMNQITLAKQRNDVNLIENRSTSDCFTDNCSISSNSSCMPANTISTANDLTIEISSSMSETAKPLDLSLGKASNIDMKISTTICSENDIVHSQHIKAADCNIISSSCDAGLGNTKFISLDEDGEKGPWESCNGLHGHQENQGMIFGQGSMAKMGLPAEEKPKHALAKQEHAFAGAMAGIFVSLCLHPIDTVKTVLQSCRADQKPLHIIGSSIIAERGMLGLYRGISSSIVSSAPISAIYTYTYESVKKNLLPLLPKEYHSLAHCIAGGCASIATSFVFTPSERIKQQMQVGSHYRNSWNAFIHIIRKGGVPSLYAGWGAVLCRNIPQSVIKFYTYENLKQSMLLSFQWNAQVNVFVTLVCGGLAGSVASLFSTPFDVVKTRLQTQVPGSVTKCSGVLTTLTEIGKREGVKGLYRGLTPRLVMYMIQGALFFASYESFKRLFSLEAPQDSAQTHHHEHKNC